MWAESFKNKVCLKQVFGVSRQRLFMFPFLEIWALCFPGFTLSSQTGLALFPTPPAIKTSILGCDGLWKTEKSLIHLVCKLFFFSLLYRTLSPVWTDWSVSLRGRKTEIFLIADFTGSANMPVFHSVSKILTRWWWVSCHFAWLRHWDLTPYLEILSPYITCTTSPSTIW